MSADARIDDMADRISQLRPEVPDRTPPHHLTRQSLAAWHFAQAAADRVRYDHGRRRWLVWSGNRWRPDEDGAVKRLWLGVLSTRYEEALAAADDARKRLTAEVQTAGATNSAIDAGLAIASNMEPVATTANAWDSDPMLLGCENGVVELRSGDLRPGRPADMISRSTGIAYDPQATSPRWSQFLDEVFTGDAALIEWFGLLVGYSLIGNGKELIAIHHGRGNNGKSVCIHALRQAVGDYAVVIAVETLVSARRSAGAATPDLMPLRGARLAFASEPDQEATLRGGALKRLASIDLMIGRGLYTGQESWEPTHTLHVTTNHLPAVDDATDGFWRRVALVPWNVHFRKPGETGGGPPEDPRLADVLIAESPGILAWAVRGAVAVASGRSLWPFPIAVRLKTDAYRAHEDKLGAFVAAQVRYEAGATVAVGALRDAYRKWCDAESIPLSDRMGRNTMASYFEARGRVTRGRDASNRAVFAGACLAGAGVPDFQTPLAGSPHARTSPGSPDGTPRKSGTPGPGTPPAADSAFCSVCGAGPFLDTAFFERHWQSAHAAAACSGCRVEDDYPASAWDLDASEDDPRASEGLAAPLAEPAS